MLNIEKVNNGYIVSSTDNTMVRGDQYVFNTPEAVAQFIEDKLLTDERSNKPKQQNRGK